MKKEFLILILLVSFNTKAQNIKAKITYTLNQVNVDSTKIISKNNRIIFNKIDEISKEFNIELIINNENSYFSNTTNPLQTDRVTQRVYNIAERAYKVKDNFYYNKKNNELIIETERFGEELLIYKKPSQEKWVYKNKTKKIGTYVCYQAQRVIKQTRLNGEVKTITQIVWYTPDIPLPFGPRDFVGFPGLVLETTVGKIKFTATKIILNPKEKIIIKTPINGKKVTEEEYKKISEKSAENTNAIFKN